MCRKQKRSCQMQPTEWVKGKVIGSGSFGSVHLAMDQATGSLFVIKSASSEAGITSLKNEASVLATLDSPYVVKSLGSDFSAAKNAQLFIEYMPGGSLSDAAANFGGRLDEKVIRSYTKSILQGLRCLHRNGIVHSDLKCKNVLLGLSGNIKLADFGCAKKVSDRKKTGSVGGTPLWMAPEVLRNEGLDFAADIWSLGCTVIEMATGKPGWDVDPANHMAAIFSIAKGDKVPQFPTKFSQEGLDFLAKCLQTDPRKRWTSKQLLEHPFVSTKSMKAMSGNEDARSPSSVLDAGSYESDDSSVDDEEFSRRWAPFLEKSDKMMSEYCLEPSDDWITVR